MDGTQLDAGASWTVGETPENVAGTFAYTPAAGTVLPDHLGQTLSVIFTPTDTTDYTSASQTTTIDVTPAVTWPAPAAITYGTALSSAQLDATADVPGSFAYAPAAGTVLQAGNDQPLSVTFTPTDTTDYATVTQIITIDVNQITPTTSWATPASIPYGTALGSTQLDATASVPGTFAYTPAAGTLLPLGNGQTLWATFTPTDTTDYTTAAQTTTIDVTVATPTITWLPAPLTYGTPLGSAQLDATADTDGTFSYTPAAGTMLPVGDNQPLSVIFTPNDTTDYTTAAQTTAINVNRASPTVRWPTPAAIAYGTALGRAQLDATASVPGTLVYTPGNGTLLHGGNNQTLSVTFTPTDTTDYNTVTQTTRINVNQVMPVVFWLTPAAIPYGTALSGTQLDATATVPGSFAYTPAGGAMLPIGNNQTLSVTFTPTDATDYTTVTQTATIDVTQATPTVSWATPAAITYGTALGGAQLDATASVPGNFAYTPAGGAMLPIGNNQTLSVTFTPTDTTDYSSVTQTTKINVTQATPTVSWPTPTAITYGTALGSTQLDATASVPGTLRLYARQRDGAARRQQPDALGDLHAHRYDRLHHGHADDHDQREPGHVHHQLADARGDHLRDGPERHAIGRHGQRAGEFRLHARRRDGAARRQQPDALGHLHAHGYDRLHHGHADDHDQREPGHVHRQLADARGDHLRDGPGRHAIGRHGQRAGELRLHARQRDGAARRQQPDALGNLHAHGYDRLHHGRRRRLRSTYQATPTISWATPTAITYGTALSGTQLDATAGVPGTFAYTPAGGTVLHAGNNQTLSVTFTPNDTTDYTTVTQTTTINVNQATPTVSWATPAAITYGTALGSTQLDATQRAGKLRLYARWRDDAGRRQQPDPLGNLHAHGCDRLHHGHADGHDQRPEGNAGGSAPATRAGRTTATRLPPRPT